MKLWLKIIVPSAIVTIIVLLVMLIPRIERFAPIDNDWSSGASIKRVEADELHVKYMGDSAKRQVMELCYPVNSIMIRHDNTSPNTLPGLANTKWTKLSTGYIKSVASGGTTGGSSVSSSTVAPVPQHNHTFTTNSSDHQHSLSLRYTAGDDFAGWVAPGKPVTAINATDRHVRSGARTSDITGGGHTHTGTTSTVGTTAGHTHNIEPPYIGVTVWKRTA